MKLYLDGSEYSLDGNFVEISYNPPASVANNFIDLEVYHIDESGEVSPLWSETNYDGSLVFQTESFSDFVIVGTRVDGDSYQNVLDESGSGVSPKTGESITTLLGVIGFMIAAAYVALRSTKPQQEN